MRYATANELDESHRFHHSLPMTYMAGYYNLILLPLQIGASVVLDRAFDVQSVLRYWDVPREHGVDVLWLVPTIMAMLLKVDRTGAGRTFCRERVRHVASGTAPLDPDLREQFEREYGVAVHDSYGLSETLLLTSSTAARPARQAAWAGRFLGSSSASRERPAPLGRSWPDPGHDARLSGGVGQVQGPALRNPVNGDGWFPTGDIGVLEADGELRITGREKDIVIRGGVNVSAVEVERARRRGWRGDSRRGRRPARDPRRADRRRGRHA